MLTNSLKILDTAKNEIFELYVSQSDGKIQWNYCRADCNSVSNHLTCRLL